MAQKNPHIITSTAVWDQWLRRLQHESPAVVNALPWRDLLQLLTARPTPDDRFFHRLGRLLIDAMPPGTFFLATANPKVQLNRTNTSRRQDSVLLKEGATYLHVEQELQVNQPIQPSKKFEAALGQRRFRHALTWITTPSQNFTLGLLTDEPLDQAETVLFHTLSDLAKLHQFIALQVEESHSLEGRLSVLTHHLSEGMLMLDDQLRITLWNRPLQRLSGYSAKEAVGQPYTTVLKRVDQPDWLNQLRTQYQNDSIQNNFTAEFEIQTKTREHKWVSLSGSFLRDSHGQIQQTVIISRDISRNKELERRKNEFISIATHELRTPITAVKGYLSLLGKQRDDFTEKQNMYLSRANDATERLVRLAEDLLQVIHVEEDRLTFNLRPTPLLPIVQKVVKDLSEKADKKGLVLNLIAPEYSTTVTIDPLRTEQVIANLIDNALKYTSRGTVEVTFTRGKLQKTSEPLIGVAVRDTGIGVSSKDMSSIFEKFQRTTEAQLGHEPGVGLGLYIVKSFVEKQNGHIKVRSRPKRGSTFEVSFPASEESALARKNNPNE